MNVVEMYSHFNGLEYLQIRKPQLLEEIRGAIIQADDVDNFATSFCFQIAEKWSQKVSANDSTQTDFVKERVSVELMWGKHASAACDFYAKHLAFYIRDQIDVGVEILPMKSLQARMSSEVTCYEEERYNMLRHGRSVPGPGVPLVLIGVDA